MKKLCLILLAGLLLCGCMPDEELPDPKDLFLEAESRTPEELAVLATKTVILDPGHGFEDPGCEYPENGVIERELTLVLAEKIAFALEQHGVTVVFTHRGERFTAREDLDALAAEKGYDLEAFLHSLVSAFSGREGEQVEATLTAFGEGVNDDGVFDPFERAYYANLYGGDLFLSVHINASGTNSYAAGSDLFICSDTPYGENSLRLMEALHASLGHSFPSRRVGSITYGWENAFVVTKYADMPALLLEAGFASNKGEAQSLVDAAWQNSFALAVAKGIELYLLSI